MLSFHVFRLDAWPANVGCLRMQMCITNYIMKIMQQRHGWLPCPVVRVNAIYHTTARNRGKWFGMQIHNKGRSANVASSGLRGLLMLRPWAGYPVSFKDRGIRI
jgi:hypothetical protein